MAESTTGNPSNIDELSVHSNEEEDTSQDSIEDIYRIPVNISCNFFLQGTCRYGGNCWYRHDSQPKFNLDYIEQNNKSSSEPSRKTDESPKTCLSELNNTQKKHISECKSLHKQAILNEESKASVGGSNPPNWVNAPEFVPRTAVSYADSLKCNISSMNESQKKLSEELCFHFMMGDCPFSRCPFIHGEICELCNIACLNPNDKRQQEMHIESCAQELEKDMELSFAVQCSINKTCGICMDVIMEKEPISERRFGILENCNHIFCVSCIRKWRQVRNFDGSLFDSVINPKVTRSCPECRVPSDFVTPSLFWVESEDEKQKLISDYKKALSKKPCKYFKKGEGTCPFGGACFYLHAKPDGTVVKLPPPRKRQRRNQDGRIDIMEEILLWSFLEARDEVDLELNDDVYIISDDSEDNFSE